MKVIIAGSRSITNFMNGAQTLVRSAVLMSGFKITEIVSGGSSGVDLLGEACSSHFDVHIKRFPYDKSAPGKSGGPRRNATMAEYADALVLVWDGRSAGSASMKREAQRVGLPIFEVVIQRRERIGFIGG